MTIARAWVGALLLVGCGGGAAGAGAGAESSGESTQSVTCVIPGSESVMGGSITVTCDQAFATDAGAANVLIVFGPGNGNGAICDDSQPDVTCGSPTQRCQSLLTFGYAGWPPPTVPCVHGATCELTVFGSPGDPAPDVGVGFRIGTDIMAVGTCL